VKTRHLQLVTHEHSVTIKTKSDVLSAFGIAQLLRERSGQPELQVLHGLRYLNHRYGGSACRALSHSDRRGWY